MKDILVLLISISATALTTVTASPLLFNDFGPGCDSGLCANFCLKQWNPWPDGYGITPKCSVSPAVPGWVNVKCECLGPA